MLWPYFIKVAIMKMRMVITPPTAWPRYHCKRNPNDCVMLMTNGRQYNWIRKVNNKNRAYCTICREEFRIGYSGEDVKVHMDTESYKSGIRETSTSESIKSFLVSQRYQCSAENSCRISLGYHMNQWALLYGTFDCSMELNKVTFPDSKQNKTKLPSSS